MSEVDLSTLSGPELRGLLDSARSRGQAAEAYQILQELADRRARDDGGRKAARSPHVIALNLGDPLEPQDEFAEVEATPAQDTDPPLALDPDRTTARKSRPPRPPRTERRRRPDPADEGQAPKRRRWPAVGFAAGIALGVTLGFGIARETLSQPAAGTATIFPAAPMLRSGEVAPTPAPPPPAATAPVDAVPLDAAPAPEVAPTAAAETPPATPAAGLEIAQATPPEPVQTRPSPPAAPQAAPPQAAPAPTVVATETATSDAPTAPKPCAGAGTPADRAICADPALQRLQAELRRAYADALEAHADRALLRQHQLAWRDARNDVSDPAELARLYEARVRKLNAAAAEARRERDGR